jgi:beta-phosphoglucomutase-like phosphatase (HAD superfamily)
LETPLAETAVFEDSALALETAKNAGFVTVGVYDSHHSSTERLAAAADFYLEKGTTLADALAHIEI